MVQWHTLAVNISANLKVKIYFTSPEFSATKIVTWECHSYDSNKGSYNKILGRDILTALGVNLTFYKPNIKGCDGSLKWSTAPMIFLFTR